MEGSSTSVGATAVKSGRAAKSAFRSAQHDSASDDSDDSSMPPGQKLCGRGEQRASASPSGMDSASDSSDSPPRKKRRSHPEPREWTDYRQCNGWADVEMALRDVCASSIKGGAELLAGINHQNASTIVYGFRCPFFNSHGCKWCCRVVIHTHGSVPPAVLCRNAADRAHHHANHSCVVQVDVSQPHARHNARQAKGPHKMWDSMARQDHSMYCYTRMQIEQWFKDNCIQLAAGEMKTAVTRCMRHNTRTGKKVVQNSFGIGGVSCQRAALIVMCDKLLFKNVVNTPGFNVHEPYFIPGSVVRDLEDDSDCRPPLVLMITTLNLILNVARSNNMPGSAGAIAGVDHTHKVLHVQVITCALPVCVNA